MKKLLPLLLVFILFQSCKEEQSATTESEKIAQTERSLCNPVVIEGDSTWIIAKRMAHYGVPGVRIRLGHRFAKHRTIPSNL